MTRFLFVIVALTLLALAGVWFLENDGSVVVEWMGYRIQTSVAFAALAGVVIVALCTLVLQTFIWFRQLPARYRRTMADRKKDKGIAALTDGFAAIAAGDAKAAQRLTKRAEYCLGSLPITRLLSAQSAQMDGNREQAKIQYSAMMEHKETELIAIKALLLQAREEGDVNKAIFLAEKARALNSSADWPISVLLDLYKHTAQWTKVEQMVDRALSHKLIDKGQATRTIAIISLARAHELQQSSQLKDALAMAQTACKMLPDFTPAITLTASLLLKLDESRKALNIMEKGWKMHAHPSIIPLYIQAMGDQNSEKTIIKTESLMTKGEPLAAAHVALARFALRTQHSHKARNHLKTALNIEETSSACTLMAELERRENAGQDIINEWESRALSSPSDRCWHCHSCGHHAAHWDAQCPHCQQFDSLQWEKEAQATPNPPIHSNGLLSVS